MSAISGLQDQVNGFGTGRYRLLFFPRTSHFYFGQRKDIVGIYNMSKDEKTHNVRNLLCNSKSLSDFFLHVLEIEENFFTRHL